MNAAQITIDAVKLIELPKIHNQAGNITALNNSAHIPFEFKRVFYLYDIPGGESRGAHAHHKCFQFLVAASGGFSVSVDDGKNQKEIRLTRPYQGVLIPPGIWASEIDFTSGSICLVLASREYEEMDYIRDYDEFKQLKGIK